MNRALLVLLALGGCLEVETFEPPPERELWWVQYPGAALAAICTFDGDADCTALADGCNGCAVTCWPTEPLRRCAPPKFDANGVPP